MNQQELANLIKQTHSSLREKVHDSKEDVEKVWNAHVEEILSCKEQHYATAMETLATQIWDQREHFVQNSRLNWIKHHIDKYFLQNWLERFELRLQRKLEFCHSIRSGRKATFELNDRISVLDVGSCYNPLSIVGHYDVIAIDLAPAPGCRTVYQCDFVSVNIEKNQTLFSTNTAIKCSFGKIQTLFEESFNCVVFSLLLEYLPCPSLRFKVCQNAYRVLKNHGLLVIITPDSSHCSKNLDQIRCWQIALAKIGFLRVFVEKLTHIRCMSFVKVDRAYEKLCCDEVDNLTRKLDQSKLSFSLCDQEKLIFIRQDKTTLDRINSEKGPNSGSSVHEHFQNELFDEFLKIELADVES